MPEPCLKVGACADLWPGQESGSAQRFVIAEVVLSFAAEPVEASALRRTLLPGPLCALRSIRTSHETLNNRPVRSTLRSGTVIDFHVPEGAITLASGGSYVNECETGEQGTFRMVGAAPAADRDAGWRKRPWRAGARAACEWELRMNFAVVDVGSDFESANGGSVPFSGGFPVAGGWPDGGCVWRASGRSCRTADGKIHPPPSSWGPGHLT